VHGNFPIVPKKTKQYSTLIPRHFLVSQTQRTGIAEETHHDTEPPTGTKIHRDWVVEEWNIYSQLIRALEAKRKDSGGPGLDTQFAWSG
jgi:hypothetical protein